MRKLTIIAGIILFILGSVYLYLFDKIISSKDLTKLIIDVCVFVLLVYLYMSGFLKKHQDYFLSIFKYATLIYLFCISGYSILRSILLNKDFTIEYISFLKRTDSFLLFILFYFLMAVITKKIYHESFKKVNKN